MAEPGEFHGTPGPAATWVRYLAERVSVGLLVGRDGRVAWANTELAELVGEKAPIELEGRALDTLVMDAGGGLPDWASSGTPESGVECWLLRREKDPLTVVVRCLGDGEASGDSWWEIRDLTELRAAEAEVHRLSRHLRRANRELEELYARVERNTGEREELLTVVSHELRTPITVIAGFNKLLLSEKVGPLTREQRHFLSEGAKSCRRLSTFIGNLIEAAREVTGERPLELVETSLSATIEGVVGFLAPLLEERQQTLTLDLAPAATRACFDPMRIEQVLTNLVGNAIKHGRRGGAIQVSSRAIEAIAPGRCFVEVAVSDDGPGIAAEDRERIFEAYVRAGDGSGAGGLGLGLAICRRIVEAHGTAILVSEVPSGGSRFSFTLPAAIPTSDVESAR
jgi:signal transduction histidine kinase